MHPNNISWKTIDKYFKHDKNVVVKHHLDSYNEFFSNGIKEIFKDRNPLKIENHEIKNIKILGTVLKGDSLPANL